MTKAALDACDIWQTIPLEQDQLIRVALYLGLACGVLGACVAVIAYVAIEKWMERKAV